jgi:hypothetical protein
VTNEVQAIIGAAEYRFQSMISQTVGAMQEAQIICSGCLRVTSDHTEELERLVNTFDEPKELKIIPDADHFFDGHLTELQQGCLKLYRQTCRQLAGARRHERHYNHRRILSAPNQKGTAFYEKGQSNNHILCIVTASCSFGAVDRFAFAINPYSKVRAHY